MSEKEDMERFLKTLPEKTQKSITVVTRDETGDLYHISRDDKIKEFIPFMTDRASSKEDRTVPRVSTAPSVLACFIGYGAALADFDKGNYAEAHGLDDYDKSMAKNKGGWYIYDFDYEFALRPGKELVHDAKISDEVWLVSYSEQSASYKAPIIGKVFYHRLISTKHAKGVHREVELYVEVFDKPIRFTNKHILTKGYWQVIGPEQANVKDYKDVKGYVVNEISKSDYDQRKRITASMLSLEW